jgi:hypothetical protein
LKWREQKNQYYWYCSGRSRGHRKEKVTSVTKGSFLYQRKTKTNWVYSLMLDAFRRRAPSDMYCDLPVTWENIAQIYNDVVTMQASDYERHELGYLLGSDARCDHIQIDESKFGKRKHHRGRRVEGVWVFGLVEALVPINPTDRYYRYMNVRLGINEIRPGFEAGRKFFITVPDRTAATLLPVIYSRCARGSVIRSDGWRAYSSLHPRAQFGADGAPLDNTLDYQNGDFHFRSHQVVNHRLDFATLDQVSGNAVTSSTPSSGLINTNMIESMWRPLKASIPPAHRTAKAMPAKLVEYLWHNTNKKNLEESMIRCLQTVSFLNDNDPVGSSSSSGNFVPQYFTEAHSGLSEEQQDRNAERDLRRFEAWITNRQATRDQQYEQLGDSESESDDDVADPTFVDSSRPLLPAPSSLAPAPSSLAPAPSSLAPAPSPLAPAPSPFAPSSSTLVPASSAVVPASSALAPASSTPYSTVPLSTSGTRARSTRSRAIQRRNQVVEAPVPSHLRRSSRLTRQ